MDIVFYAKALGFVAFIITCAGYLRSNENDIRLAVAISASILAVHFGMMSEWVPAVSLCINAIRNQVSRKRTGFRWFLLFAGIQLTFSFALYQDISDLLPIAASLVSGYAMFCTTGTRFRILMLLCTSLWFGNNVRLRTYGAMLQDILTIAVILAGICKTRNTAKMKT